MTTTEVATTTDNNQRAIVAFNAALTHEKADTVILCDVSGSMDQFTVSGLRRIQVMKNCLLRIVGSIDKAAVVMFGLNCRILDKWEHFNGTRYECGWSTNLAAALRRAKRLNPSHIIVLTDGEPNSAVAAKDEARSILAKIDVYYCGNSKGETVEFCRDLAQYGGQAVIDPECVIMLESVKLFLTDTIAA